MNGGEVEERETDTDRQTDTQTNRTDKYISRGKYRQGQRERDTDKPAGRENTITNTVTILKTTKNRFKLTSSDHMWKFLLQHLRDKENREP